MGCGMDSHIYSEKVFGSLKRHLDDMSKKSISYPRFIFLCGKEKKSDTYDKTNRGIVENYFKKDGKDKYTVVLSENLWEDAFSSKTDLLTFEIFLAEISDYIILFPESPGSFCELGAFSYGDDVFGKKLIIVNDEKYRNSQSFISTGAIKKAESNGAKIIYSDLNGALLSSKELRSQLKQIVESGDKMLLPKNDTSSGKTLLNIHSFIVELLELIKLLEPIESKDLIEIYKRLKGIESFSFANKNDKKIDISVDHIYKLLIISRIIKKEDNAITLVNPQRVDEFMFKYFGKAFYKERSKILCRRFRFGE